MKPSSAFSGRRSTSIIHFHAASHHFGRCKAEIHISGRIAGCAADATDFGICVPRAKVSHVLAPRAKISRCTAKLRHPGHVMFAVLKMVNELIVFVLFWVTESCADPLAC